MTFSNFLRPLAVYAMSAAMLVSLACSMSASSGHADSPIAESAEQIEPLGAGDRAPRFGVRDLNGKRVDFDPTELDRPVLVITFRGGWCPYCNLYLADLRHVMPEIEALDVDVLFLSGDRPEQLYASLEQQTREEIDGLGYTILSDADANAAVALGIAFRAGKGLARRLENRGNDIGASALSRHGVLPVPAVFAIDADGVIRFAFTNPNYKQRLPADELLTVATRYAGT